MRTQPHISALLLRSCIHLLERLQERAQHDSTIKEAASGFWSWLFFTLRMSMGENIAEPVFETLSNVIPKRPF